MTPSPGRTKPPPPSPAGAASSSPRRLHSVRFYRPPPSAAHCMAFSGPEEALLALSRADGAVEVWNLRGRAPILERRVLGSPESSVEALSWARGRLFAATTQGLLLELDARGTLSAKRQFAVTAGAAWCMQYNEKRNRLAVGTEEGYVCLVEVTQEGMEYDRVLDKQEGRILCLAWHSSGNVIVTGSSDTIRVWDVKTGHPTARMTTGRAERNRETVVWSVALTDDLTVVSGDSRGKTCFWSAATGTLVDAYQTHAADVLSVCLSPEQDVAYSSGVDPNIVHFQPVVRKGGRSKWVKSVHRLTHSHDVRALAAGTLKAEDKGDGDDDAKRRVRTKRNVLFSAGVDAKLAINDLESKTVSIVPPIPGGNPASCAPDAGIILLRYPTHLELWTLGKGAEPKGKTSAGTVLQLEEDACKLVELRAKDDESIRTCCISKDGHFVAYATASRLRVYRLTANRDVPPVLKRLHVRPPSPSSSSSGAVVKPAHHLAFHKARGELLAATEEGGLQFFSLDGEEVRLAGEVEGTALGLTAGVSCLAVDPELDLAAAADFNGNVVALDLSKRRTASRAPAYAAAPVSCMEIDAERETLLIAYSDQHLVECNLRTGKYTKFSTSLRLPRFFKNRRVPTRGLFRVPGEEGGRRRRLVVYDDSGISAIDRKDEFAGPGSPASKARRRRTSSSGGKTEESAETEEASVTCVKKFEHLAFLRPLSDGSLVAVEIRPRSFEEQLPPSLKQKKYGAM